MPRRREERQIIAFFNGKIFVISFKSANSSVVAFRTSKKKFNAQYAHARIIRDKNNTRCPDALYARESRRVFCDRRVVSRGRAREFRRANRGRGLINYGAAVLRCLANMSSREPSGLRMYDGDAAMGGARERASRCRRPGFHECVWTGVAENRSGGERVSPGSALSLGGRGHSSCHTCRRDLLFIRIARLVRRLFDARSPDVYSAHIYLFSAPTDRRSLRFLHQ